jgi:hypothetical protein
MMGSCILGRGERHLQTASRRAARVATTPARVYSGGVIPALTDSAITQTASGVSRSASAAVIEAISVRIGPGSRAAVKIAGRRR